MNINSPGESNSKSYGYYSGNTNILQTLVDCVFDASVMFFKWLFDGWVDNSHNMDDFIKNTKFTVDKDLKPRLKEQGEKGNFEYYLFQIPTGMCIADFEKRREQFAFFLHCEKNQIKFIQDKYDIEMRVYRKQIESVKYDPVNFLDDKEFRVPIGINIDTKEVVYWYPSSPNEAHLLIGGSTGSGKSVSLSVILAHLIATRNDVELYLQDTKNIDLDCFEKADCVKYYAEGTKFAEETAKELVDEMTDRYSWLKKNGKGAKNLAECKVKDKPPFIFFVIEELASFMGEKSKKNNNDKNKEGFYDYIQQLSAKGRAAGIFLIITTQAPYSDVLPGMTKNNINATIGLKAKTGEASKTICGDYDLLTGLSGYGHGYLITANDKTEIKGFDIDNNTIDKIVKDSQKKKSL